MNFESLDTDMGLSAGSLVILTIESRLGGILSLTRSSFRASSKLFILLFHSSSAIRKKK